FILMEALRTLGKVPYDVYAVSTVQEEVGLRGANVAAHNINPDFGIALDTTIAYDVPGAAPDERLTELGKGAAIIIMDGMTICDDRMVDVINKTAEARGKPCVRKRLAVCSTALVRLQRVGKEASLAGATSIPSPHRHQVSEKEHNKEIALCLKMLTGCLVDI